MKFLIQSLAVSVSGNHVVEAVTLRVEPGSVHVIMGPNGSGKSSCAYALMGHPRYDITSGSIYMGADDITSWSTAQRAQAGLFLALQHPVEIPGLTVFEFLKESYYALHGVLPLQQFQELLYKALDVLGMDHAFAYRQVNVGFSGGEKKRLEVLQLVVLKPKVAILDELDSGLDVDALKTVAHALNTARNHNPSLALIIITHYQRILRYITPDYVHIMHKGSVVRSGDAQLAHEIEQQGYDAVLL